MNPASVARRRAWQFGRWAETAAVLWLGLKGYRILARGVRSGRGSGAGEVDIVARRGAVVAFIEVKARPSLAEAARALGPVQRRRIERAAAGFVARRPDLAACFWRFDLIVLAPWRRPRHVVDAWRPGDAGIRS